ncbi:hypothetical protein E4T56_gene11107 [Termitomyces sp. T112]|nr:hypothetical protein E4T56_gene11107 [Termitomyces sp. T112]
MKPLLPVLSCLVVPEIFFTLLIATRPSFILRLLGSLALVYTTYYVAATYTTGDVARDWAIGSALGTQPFSAVILLWLTDPMKEFRYTSDPKPTPLGEKRSLGSRLYKALCILLNLRFVGLNVQLRHIPQAFQGTRSQFIQSRIFRILQCLLLIDLGQSFIYTHAEFFLQGTSAFPSGLHGHILHFVCQLSWVACAYAGLKLLYTITSLTCVSIGSPLLAGSPEQWPDMFGSWSDAYTVRRTWGRVWHQSLSRYCSTLGKVAALSSGGCPGSFFSSQIQVWVAFTISGIIHSFGDLMIGPQFTGRSIPFFLMNAAAITFEDSIFAVTRKMGLAGQTRISRVIGYTWVLMWFNYSLPTFYTWTLEAGLGKDEMLPFSLVRLLVPQRVKH